MKKKSSVKAAKKKTVKAKVVVKSGKVKADKKARPSPRKSADERERATAYTPPAVQGIGWAPFRYPPQ